MTALTDELRRVGRANRLAHVLVDPEVEEGDPLIRHLAAAGWTKSPGVQTPRSRLVDLARPEEELWADLRSKWRQYVNKARRAGVTIEDVGDAGLDDFYLTNLQGNPWQTALSASRMILSGTLDELGDLDLVLVHGGGHLLYQIGRLDHGHRVRPEAHRPADAPSGYLRRFHYDSLTHSTDSTRWLIERVGADRVMFGTDAPFDMAGGTFAEQLTGFTGPADELSAVAAGNADRLFSLKCNGAHG